MAFPSRIEIRGIPFYTVLSSNYNTQYLGVKGYGAYPGDIIIQSKEDASVKPGMDLEMVTYVHASWGVTKYQGMKLEIFYPESGISGFGIIKVQQDSNKVKDYFNINIDPNILLIEPSWPLFYSGWTQKVKIKIHINEDTPAGSYLIGISPVDPPYDLQMKWLRQYKFGYTNAGGIGLDRPTYQIFIVVS